MKGYVFIKSMSYDRPQIFDEDNVILNYEIHYINNRISISSEISVKRSDFKQDKIKELILELHKGELVFN